MKNQENLISKRLIIFNCPKFQFYIIMQFARFRFLKTDFNRRHELANNTNNNNQALVVL